MFNLAQSVRDFVHFLSNKPATAQIVQLNMKSPRTGMVQRVVSYTHILSFTPTRVLIQGLVKRLAYHITEDGTGRIESC